MKSFSLFLPDHRLILEVVQGTITAESLIATRAAEKEKGWIQPDTNTLVFGLADAIDLSLAELGEYVEWSRIHLSEIEDSKVAIVARSAIETAVAMMLRQATAGIRTMQVFSTLDGACKWLDIPTEVVLKAFPEAKRFFNG